MTPEDIEQLKQLKQLLDDGVLSAEEFALQKSLILAPPQNVEVANSWGQSKNDEAPQDAFDSLKEVVETDSFEGVVDSHPSPASRLLTLGTYGTWIAVALILVTIAVFAVRSIGGDSDSNVPEETQIGTTPSGQVILLSAAISGADFSSSNLSSADLRNVDLSGADLVNVNLSNANLAGANLANANLTNANLDNANLSYANLQGARLPDASLEGANLSYADLVSADLQDANLLSANLSYAITDGANFNGVNLDSANLDGVNLDSSNMDGTNRTPVETSTTIPDLEGLENPSAPMESVFLSNLRGITSNVLDSDLLVAGYATCTRARVSEKLGKNDTLTEILADIDIQAKGNEDAVTALVAIVSEALRNLCPELAYLIGE